PRPGPTGWRRRTRRRSPTRPIRRATPRGASLRCTSASAFSRKIFRPGSTASRRWRCPSRKAVASIQAKGDGTLIGLSGGASGGDILFHEVCEELNIPSQMFLVLPKADYIKASVADAGPAWIERFNRLYDKLKVRVLSDAD